jgi:hypothetical protein
VARALTRPGQGREQCADGPDDLVAGPAGVGRARDEHAAAGERARQQPGERFRVTAGATRSASRDRPRYRVEINDGAAALTDPGPRADCWISAGPVAFLLVGYGRSGQWGPILRGQLLAGGREPWLGLAFGQLITGP